MEVKNQRSRNSTNENYLPSLALPFFALLFQIIYVIRNPKDTCLSFYHHVILLHGYKGNFDNFSKLFLAGKGRYLYFIDVHINIM